MGCRHIWRGRAYRLGLHDDSGDRQLARFTDCQRCTIWSSAFEAPIVIRVNILIEVAIMLGIAASIDMRTDTGLQIYQNNSWQDVPAIPDTFIINLGGPLL